jgi:hypothetical protein
VEALEARELLASNFAAPLLNVLPSVTPQVYSTVPSNGDVNPYGIAVVPQDFRGHGVLQAGDTLVSNFNNSANLQGTGTTIERISANGQRSVFFQAPPGTTVGLDAALGILKSGYVIVGSVPTSDGTPNTVQPGSLLILDANGHIVTTITDHTLLNGPWDLAINDQGDRAEVFVSNVLSGTVTRIDLKIQGGKPVVVDKVQIASGYGHRLDPAALVVGPAGLAYDASTDTLYIASSADNEIFAVAHAGATFQDHGKGKLIYQDNVHLHGPLGLALAPNGDLITANSDAQNVDANQPSELVEFTKTGRFVGQFSVDPANGGAFNVKVYTANGQIRVAAVDDNTNTLSIWGLSGISIPMQYQHRPDLDVAVWSDFHCHHRWHHAWDR